MPERIERTRRDFLRDAARMTGGAAAMVTGMPLFAAAAAPDLVVATGEDPKATVRKAVEALGGMKRFVSKGAVVVVKPNIGWEKAANWAANTNPDVVVAVIEMVFDAGAKEVKLFDRPVQDPAKCYAMSGIEAAAKKAGAKVFFHESLKTARMPIKGGRHLKESRLWLDAVECDCYINLPVAKHHGGSQLTMAMKNHMGLTADDRGFWHENLDQAIADFSLGFQPKLNILDAWRIVHNGPDTRSLNDVELVKKIIVGVNQASIDAFGTTLFGKKPAEIRHIALAGEMGVGPIDLQKINVREIRA